MNKSEKKTYYLVDDLVTFLLLCGIALGFLFAYFQAKPSLVCVSEFGDNQQELLRVSA